MSPATAALRIKPPIAASIELLERAIRTSTTSGEIASKVLEAAADLVPCAGGALFLLSPATEMLEVAATTVPKKYAVGKRLKNPAKPPAGSQMIPLVGAAEEFGFILLLDAKAPSAASNQLLEQVLTLAAILRPFTEAEALRHRLTESNAIVEVGQVLTGFLAMDDVLSYVVYLAESLVGGNCATIALLSPDNTELVLKNSTGSLRAAEGQAIPVEGSLMGWVVKNGEPVITPSISDDPRSYELQTRQGPGLLVPVHINGETIGAFLVSRLEDGSPFTQENLSTLQRMAAYAAIAIHNAQLYREQTDAAHALREQTSELQGAYSELNRQQEQLLISEKMAALGRITAGIAHEINSPLGGIMNALRTARGYVEEYRASAGDPEITAEDHIAIAADMLSAVTLAEGAASKVAQFVRSIKTQTRPGEGQMSVFDPASEIDATVVLLQHRLKKDNVGVFCEMEKGISLSGDQGKFALVVQNLVVNAADAYEGASGEVWVRLYQKDNNVHVDFEDHGCGIPEEIRGKIFDYLFTTKDVGKGTGLGLAMVHSVVTTDFGGEIAIDSEVGRGTIFKLTLPVTRTEN